MKKHNLFKVVGCLLLVLVLVSWFFKTADITTSTDGKEFIFQDGSYIRIGIFSLLSFFAIGLQYFSHIALYILCIGVLYGVLYKIPAYRRLLDYIADGFKEYEWIFIGMAMLGITLLVSMVGLQVAVLAIFPLIISIILLLGYDRITAAMVTVGSVAVGLIGTVFSSSTAIGQSYFLNNAANENVLIKIILLVVSFAIMYVNTLMYAKKHKDNNEEDYGILVPEKGDSRKSFVPVAIILDLTIIVLGLGFFSWDLFNIDIFQNISDKVINSTGVLSAFNAVIGATSDTVFGNWTLIEASVVLLIASGLLALMYGMKFDEFLSTAKKGAKKALKPAFLVLLIYTSLIIVSNIPMQFSVIKPGLGGAANILVVALIAIIFSIIFVESQYAMKGASTYLSTLTANNSFILGLVFQAMYGLTTLFGVTSVPLMATLAYLKINYFDWLKAIWKPALELLVVLLIILTIVNGKNDKVVCKYTSDNGEITLTATLDSSNELKEYQAKYHLIYSSEEEFNKACESAKVEDPTEKDGLKEESSCDKKNKTLDYSYTFNIKNLNDENTNHDVLAEITQYASEGKIDLDSWMQAAESQGFTCKKN